MSVPTVHATPDLRWTILQSLALELRCLDSPEDAIEKFRTETHFVVGV